LTIADQVFQIFPNKKLIKEISNAISFILWMDSKGYYAILEVSEHSSYQDIKRSIIIIIIALRIKLKGVMVMKAGDISILISTILMIIIITIKRR